MASTYEKNWAIRTAAINASTWTDIPAPPVSCNLIVVFNNTGQDVYLRSDPNNSASQVIIQTGQQFEIGVSSPPAGGGMRFQAGSSDIAGALLSSSSGVSPAIEYIQ